jgi:hypothetical protein
MEKAWTEMEVGLNETSLIVLDFLISILQLNALLIENNNDWR